MEETIEEYETIEDILSEMRYDPFSWCYPEGIPQTQHDNNEAAIFADRIEAACKREIAALEAACKREVGMVIALRAERDQWRKQALEEDDRANAATVGKEDWAIVRAVADEMLNMSMHDIDAEHIYGWAVRIGELASKYMKGDKE